MNIYVFMIVWQSNKKQKQERKAYYDRCVYYEKGQDIVSMKQGIGIKMP